MYDIMVPIFNRSVTPETKEIYLKQFQDAKIKRIFLCVFGFGADSEADEVLADSIKKNVSFFRENGIDAGIWLGSTIGHGMDLAVIADCKPDLFRYTKMVNVIGQERD